MAEAVGAKVVEGRHCCLCPRQSAHTLTPLLSYALPFQFRIDAFERSEILMFLLSMMEEKGDYEARCS